MADALPDFGSFPALRLKRQRAFATLLFASVVATLGSCTAPARDEAATAPSVASPGDASGTAAPAEPAEPAISSELALETFDAVWSRISETDFDETHGGVDWNAVRDELRPQAANAATQQQLRHLLQEMLSRLNRSHFAIIPGGLADRKLPEPAVGADDSASSRSTTADTGDAHDDEEMDESDEGDEDPDSTRDETDHDATFGMNLRLVEGKATVVAVAADSAADRKGVSPGCAIISFDGRDPTHGLEEAIKESGPMGRYVAQAFVQSLDTGTRTRHTIVLQNVDGTERTITMRRRASPAKMVKIGTLPAMPLLLESGWVDGAMLARAGAPDARIGFIRFTVWLPEVAASFNRAVDELRAADGLILDLRGNPGGFGGMVTGIGGHFVQEPVSIGSMKTRESTLEFRLNPRRATSDGRIVEPISAPLAILIDPLSASTSEIFAGGLQDIGRARVFGESSAGAALPAQMHRLPNGDVLLHAFADYRVPSGRQLEGTGVIPDQPRELLRKDLSTDGDPVMLDAVRWILSTPSRVP